LDCRVWMGFAVVLELRVGCGVWRSTVMKKLGGDL
jgi:hypothetical protein